MSESFEEAMIKLRADTGPTQEAVRRVKEGILKMAEDVPLSVAEIMELLAHGGLHKGNFDELVPQMLRAVCKDEYVDAVEEFICQFDDIEWNWYPNG